MSHQAFHTRPVILTDERLKANIEKLEKQKLFKEALDEQVRESKRLKATEDAQRNRRGTSQRALAKPRIEPPATEASPPASSPIDAVSVRYTFSFEGGRAQFSHASSSETRLVHSPHSPQGVAGSSRPSGSSGRRLQLSKALHTEEETTGLYQTTSLPTSFSLSQSPPNSREAYDTQSLPVDLIRAYTKRDLPSRSPVSRSPRGAEASCSEDAGHHKMPRVLPTNVEVEVGDLEAMAPSTPTTSVGPSPLHLFGNSSVASSRHDKTGAPKKQTARNLPPIELEGAAKERLLRDQKSANASRGPRNRQALSGNNSQTHAAKTTEMKANRLQKEVECQQTRLEKMAQKERSWEHQVKKLKEELRKARRNESNSRQSDSQRRAETAPEGQEIAKRNPTMFPNRARYGNGGRRAPLSQANPEFSRARIFTADTFRRVESPPLEDVSINHDLTAEGPLADPFNDTPRELADSMKTSSDRAKHDVVVSVPIAYEHLVQFSQEQIITGQQAVNLWKFFLSLHEKDDQENALWDEDVSVVVEEVHGEPQTPEMERQHRSSLLESSSTFDHTIQAKPTKRRGSSGGKLEHSSSEPEEVLSTRKPMLTESLQRKISDSRQKKRVQALRDSHTQAKDPSTPDSDRHRRIRLSEDDTSIEALLQSSESEDDDT